jgi:hypothetical protein
MLNQLDHIRITFAWFNLRPKLDKKLSRKVSKLPFYAKFNNQLVLRILNILFLHSKDFFINFILFKP